MKLIALAGCVVVLAACSTQPSPQAKSTQAPPTATPTITAGPSASPDPAAAPDPTHAFVIVLENRSYAQAASIGYIAELSRQYGLATNYNGVYHPSLPNYLAMTSGSTWGVADDGWHPLPAGGLGSQLTNAGIDWRAYMEGMAPGGCLRNGNGYALKHDPFAYYGAQCPSQVVPFSNFASDMAGTVPRFVWITPNLCNDGHDCGNGTVDAWLRQTVPTILNTDAWQDNGVLFITWDEGEDSSNTVLTLVIRPNPIKHTSSFRYNHYSLLATIEDTLGVPRLGAAAQATPMNDLMAVKPVPVLRNRT